MKEKMIIILVRYLRNIRKTSASNPSIKVELDWMYDSLVFKDILAA